MTGYGRAGFEIPVPGPREGTPGAPGPSRPGEEDRVGPESGSDDSLIGGEGGGVGAIEGFEGLASEIAPLITQGATQGTTEGTTGGAVSGFTVEVKSLNHRNFDLKLRAPERFFPLEANLRQFVKQRFERGSFTVLVSRETTVTDETLRLNVPLVEAYLEAEKELRKNFAVDGRLDPAFILGSKDVFVKGAVSSAASSASSSYGQRDDQLDWDSLKRGLDKALGELALMREAEGVTLKGDVELRLAEVEGILDDIEKRLPGILEDLSQRLSTELREFIDKGIDEQRLVAEVAFFAEKTNVAEEITRTRSHLTQMRRYLDVDEPVGRRLDFLCQELLREINTISSKTPDVKVTQAVVEIKGELEKIREQVQNIE